MRKVWSSFVTVVLCLLALPAHSQGIRRAQQPVPEQYIVIFKDQAPGARGVRSGAARLAGDLARAYGVHIGRVYQHAVNGFAARMPEAGAAALSRDPRVAFVEEDGAVSATDTQFDAPWGLDRIGQRDLPLNGAFTFTATGSGVNVYVIDSGIRATHQEFGGRASRVFDAFGGDGDDGNGHGTHVAGTIGGSTYGVAKDVQLFGVRVLDEQGDGTISGVVAGVDWVTANHAKPAVANMSLGGAASRTLDTAVRNSVAAGVTYVVSAGNDNVNAANASPARVAEAITVGATDIRDNRAWFSNYGSALDVFAPGVNIISTWIGSDTATATLSGTSMAAPHVAGAAALFLQGDPQASPAAVSEAITSSATTGKVVRPGTGSPNRLLFVGTQSPGSYSLTAAPDTAAPGGDITVSWTAPAGRATTDWVGLYRPGAPDDDYLWWEYTGGAASGSATAAPAATGQYEFRYFLQDGYTRAATSNVITVQ